MKPHYLSDKQLREMEISEARDRAYQSVISFPMNRAARRTAHGRLLIARAELAAMQAELEVIKSQLAEFEP